MREFSARTSLRERGRILSKDCSAFGLRKPAFGLSFLMEATTACASMNPSLGDPIFLAFALIVAGALVYRSHVNSCSVKGR
ncbi:hypothetical protein SADO_14138 [Salinisphaera dokdonensis CL-ES53]|uniref:Uncharacterized protein n=1 Tax=Salinisphaera dokdonensis CL-ES53 TaxID=1304272 RepID=A0ABV2B3I8_9GAMM